MKFALIISLLLCAMAKASITYDVSIDTASLPAGQYQAAFFLSNLTDNWMRAPRPDGFSIDGDILTDSTRYYADQPVIPFTVGEPGSWPLNFNLTLTGSPGSDDYFLMAIRTPDGGILSAPDGSEWLLWAAMDVDSPVLHEDLPGGMNVDAVTVPEPCGFVMVACLALAMFRRPKH